MNRHLIRLFPLVLSLVLATNTGAAAETTLMTKFLDTFVGTWATDMVLDEDVPGEGEKGDKVPFVGTNRKILKGNAMESSWKCGSTRGKALGTHDCENGCIRFNGVNSAGMTLCIEYARANEQWVAKVTSTEPDGTKRTSNAVLTISDGGNTHTWAYSQRKKDGEQLPDMVEVWHRQKK